MTQQYQPTYSSGLTVAIDAVLRGHVGALPGVARSIRRFAEAPIEERLEHALRSGKTTATVAHIEQLLWTHSEDLRMEALERENATADSSVCDALALSPRAMHRVLLFGAQHGSVRIVEWALATESALNLYAPLQAAVTNGHLAVVQVLHPHAVGLGSGLSEGWLLDEAAAQGHLALLQWLYANLRCVHTRFTSRTSAGAAYGGHLEVLEWIIATSGVRWPTVMLESAALRSQWRVLAWVYDQRLRVSAFVAMNSVVVASGYGAQDVLEWLHDKYPRNQINSETIASLYTCNQLALVRWLAARYPALYAVNAFDLGVQHGDLEIVVITAPHVFLRKPSAKKAMVVAASGGHLAVVQWLSRAFDGYLPTKVAWCALRCEHVHILEWCKTQQPMLFTPQRLAAMHAASVRQQQAGADASEQTLATRRWIETQQQQEQQPCIA